MIGSGSVKQTRSSEKELCIYKSLIYIHWVKKGLLEKMKIDSYSTPHPKLNYGCI